MLSIVTNANANLHSVDSHAGVGVGGPVSGVWPMHDLCAGVGSDTGEGCGSLAHSVPGFLNSEVRRRRSSAEVSSSAGQSDERR